MLDFLRMLSPHHANALKPVPSRGPDGIEAFSARLSRAPLTDSDAQPEWSPDSGAVPPATRERGEEPTRAMEAAADVLPPAPPAGSSRAEPPLTALAATRGLRSSAVRAAAPIEAMPASDRSAPPARAVSAAGSVREPPLAEPARAPRAAGPTSPPFVAVDDPGDAPPAFMRPVAPDPLLLSVAAVRRPHGAPLHPSVVARLGPAGPASDAAPIVHLTIDRLEVRAPSSPPKAHSPPRRKGPAVQSLDEYLRSGRTGAAP